jgi:hypothetical protein
MNAGRGLKFPRVAHVLKEANVRRALFDLLQRCNSVARMREAAISRPFAGCSLEAVDPVKRFGADKHERLRHVV